MISLKKLQKQIYANKIKKGFNTTDIYILNINLEKEIKRKVLRNSKRVYKRVNGVLIKTRN